MEQQETWAITHRISIAEKQPELADSLDEGNAGRSLAAVKKNGSYITQLCEEVAGILGKPRYREIHSGGPEPPVKVISYMGSATDTVGNDGDFYVDELTNILYGPKAGGVWPEDGVVVDGPVVCKRTFLQLKSGRRIRRASGFSGFLRRLSSSLRSRLRAA
jgi:hypothetical protein